MSYYVAKWNKINSIANLLFGMLRYILFLYLYLKQQLNRLSLSTSFDCKRLYANESINYRIHVNIRLVVFSAQIIIITICFKLNS